MIGHGHRYDAGAAPDSLSNTHVTGRHSSILPIGYFLTKMTATSVSEGASAPVGELPVLPVPTNGTDEQRGTCALYRFRARAMSEYPIGASMHDAIFHAEFAGYPEPVSLRDLVPALRADGWIGAPLYGDLPQQWDALQAANRIARSNSFTNSGTWIDHKLLGPTGTFVAIEPGTESTDVRVLQYRPQGGMYPVSHPS